MLDLISTSPCKGLLPIVYSGLELSETAPDSIVAISPFRGKEAAVSEYLKTRYGVRFPAVNRVAGNTRCRMVWAGDRTALLLGPPPHDALKQHAAIVDQTAGWTVLRLEGHSLLEVLARLTPLDLRPSRFKRGHSACSLLGEIPAIFLKIRPEAFLILAPRSMAASAVEQLGRAMKAAIANPG